MKYFRALNRTILASATIVLAFAVNTFAQTGRPPIAPPVSPSVPMRDSTRPTSDRFNPPPMAPEIPPAAQARRRSSPATICGNPKLPCPTAVTFHPYDLPFRVPASLVIHDTELFYAVIFKSMPAPNDNCDIFIAESDRLDAQALFPDRKVFASRCAEPESLFYTNTKRDHRIMAVYAGKTLGEANRVLAAVKAIGKFPGANVRRMRTGFNGT